MLASRTHSADTEVGEKIPTSEIMAEWGKIIKDKGPNTIIVADSYYLDNPGRDMLVKNDIQFICAINIDRFAALKAVVAPLVTKPGEMAAIFNEELQEVFVHVWDQDVNVGKKYVLSNAFRMEKKRKPKCSRPVWDEYKVSFGLADHFNRELHDCTWPHRHGGGITFGERTSIHDFWFSCILKNTQNVYFDLYPKFMQTYDFQEFCLELADEIYLLSQTM